MNNDIRLSTSYFDNPKVKRLKRLLGLQGVMSHIQLLCWTGRVKPAGVLSDMDALDVADAAAWEGDADQFVNTLLDLKLLDRNAEGHLTVHDWEDHNEYAAHAESRRKKAKKAAEARWENAQKSEETCSGNAKGKLEQCSEHDLALPEASPSNAPSPAPVPSPKEIKTSSPEPPAEGEQKTGPQKARGLSKPEKPGFDAESVEFSLARLLRDLINARSPTGKPLVPEKTNLQTWARQIDLMIRLDARDPPEIEAVIRWCQSDPFWRSNIMSTAKLREKYGTLVDRMNGDGRATGKREAWEIELEQYEASHGTA